MNLSKNLLKVFSFLNLGNCKITMVPGEASLLHIGEDADISGPKNLTKNQRYFWLINNQAMWPENPICALPHCHPHAHNKHKNSRL